MTSESKEATMKKAVENSFPVHFFLLFLVVWNICQVSAAFRLTVLHTNDLHSRFDQVSKKGGDCDSKPPCYGGVARIKHLADTIRAQNPNTVFLNAGDFFQVRLTTTGCPNKFWMAFSQKF